MTTVDEPRVLRASRQRYRRWLRGSLASGGLLVAFLVASNLRRADSLTDVLILVVLLVGTPAAALSAVATHIATSRVTIVGDEVEYRRWWRRTVLRAGDGLVGLLAVYSPRFSTGPATPVLVARGVDGGPRIHLSGAYWDLGDLDEIAAALRIPVRDRTLDAKGYERRAPGALPWRERHPWAFGLGGAAVITAIVTAGVLAYFTSNDLPPFDEQPPRAVAAETVARQDAVARDVVAAVGGSWEAPDEQLRRCKDDDDVKGWERTLDIAPIEMPSRLTNASLAAVVDAMARQGYLRVTGSKVDDVAGHLLGASFSEDEVRVDLEDGFSGITVRGHCETPDR